MMAGRSPWLCQGTIPPGSMVSLRKRSWRSLIFAGSFSRSMAASTVSVTPLAACDTGSRALVLTWSAGHWPATADDRPMASEPMTTPARMVVRPMARPLMMRSNMIVSPLLSGSARLLAAPVQRIGRRALQWKCQVALESIAGCYVGRKRISWIGHRRRLASPRPLALDLEHERPAQEGTHQHQAGQQGQAPEVQLERDRLDDVGGDQHLKAKQQRAAYSDLVDVVGVLDRQPSQKTGSRPDNPEHDQEDTEQFDPVADDLDQVTDRRLEHLAWIGAAHGQCPQAHAPATWPNRRGPGHGLWK